MKLHPRHLIVGVAAALLLVIASAPAADVEKADAQPPGLPPPEGLIALTPDNNLWIDPKRKLVIVDGKVCLRQGQLEMFACPKQTKEHESIVAVDCKPRFVHAGLLAVGARQGHPVQFDPKYVPASGTVIDIWVLWRDAEGKKQKARAQQWVRNTGTGKEMDYEWVFAGSGLWKDAATGEQFYYGDAGDFICVSNFPSATLDLPVESTQANANLLFEAFTERIPPKGTMVRLVLSPRAPKKDGAPPADAKAPADTQPPAGTKPPADADNDGNAGRRP